MILAGDIGGTKSLLAFFSPRGDPRAPRGEKSFPSRNYSGLEGVLADFLREVQEPVELACFGVPGPVVEGRCETPNLPWVVDARQLQRATKGRIILINDLEATGHGIPALKQDELLTLSQGRPNPQGNAALIAPGTGLGECILFWNGQERWPSASEGGHASFAPQNDLESRFLQWMRNDFDHVSYDRVVSGSGLKRIYDFLKESGYAEEPGWLREAFTQAQDPAAVISKNAMEGKAELCVKALDLWVDAFGAEAGNLALKALATAGVYLGGGIAPKILPKLKDGTFITAFSNKGRLSGVLGHIPVQVIVNDKAALFGAARYALREQAARNRK